MRTVFLARHTDGISETFRPVPCSDNAALQVEGVPAEYNDAKVAVLANGTRWLKRGTALRVVNFLELGWGRDIASD